VSRLIQICGCEDVILTLERTHTRYVSREEYLVLAQFELLPNYRRYPSVLADLERREGRAAGAALEAWAERIFGGADASDILDVRGETEKRRLHAMKEGLWRRFGYSDDLFTSMRGMAFWDAQAGLVGEIDRRITGCARKQPPVDSAPTAPARSTTCARCRGRSFEWKTRS